MATLALQFLTGCAHLDTSDEFFTRWGLRGIGAIGAFALHEACHVATGHAFGAEIDASWRGSGPYLEFSDLSRNEHLAVSVMGNACTGVAAELIVDTGSHKKSNLAWGAAAFHAINAFGYAFSHEGDAAYWEESGGTRTSWQLLNAGHATRIGAQLTWDSKLGEYLRERWRFGAPTLPPVSGEAVDASMVETIAATEDPEALEALSRITLPPLPLPAELASGTP